MLSGAMTPKRLRAAANRALGTLLVSVGMFACNSPTLPVPPPYPEKLAQPSEVELLPDSKHVRIASDGALRVDGVEVFMFNEELGAGQRADKDEFGHYEGIVPVDLSCSRPTNHVDLWQAMVDSQGGIESPITIVTVPRGAAGADLHCDNAEPGPEPQPDGGASGD